MKILVTGAAGFIGRNLIVTLKTRGYTDILEFDTDTPREQLDIFTKECEFVFHLAGVNRPHDESEFDNGNRGFTCELLDKLIKGGNPCPVAVSSSIQSEYDNPYGKSKKAMEDELFSYAEKTGASVYIYRLPNVFGKWCRPDYNSAVATFCYNIARDLPVQVNDPEVIMNLVYIDDVVNEFINMLEYAPLIEAGSFCSIPIIHKIKLGDIVNKLYSFKENRKTLVMPSLENEFDRELYSTYLSYLPENDFSYSLDMKQDDRGWFCEFMKSDTFGQVSVSKSKAGVKRGNHWHHTKSEKFLVVQGTALVKLKKIYDERIIEYTLSSDKLNPIDIPAGYTHSIENIGDGEMILLIWSNQQFDPNKPDTYFLDTDN